MKRAEKERLKEIERNAHFFLSEMQYQGATLPPTCSAARFKLERSLVKR